MEEGSGDWSRKVLGNPFVQCPPPSLRALWISFCALLVAPELGGDGAGQR